MPMAKLLGMAKSVQANKKDLLVEFTLAANVTSLTGLSARAPHAFRLWCLRAEMNTEVRIS